jgi:hypothetical protein
MDENDIIEMKAEINAGERTSSDNMLLNTLRNIKFKDMNSTEQFYTLVNASFNELKSIGIPFINDERDLEIILENIYKLKKPGFKNAPSYILGYYTSNNGYSINKNNIDIIFTYLPAINNLNGKYPYPIFNIKKQDVLRYTRLWLKTNSNL